MQLAFDWILSCVNHTPVLAVPWWMPMALMFLCASRFPPEQYLTVPMSSADIPVCEEPSDAVQAGGFPFLFHTRSQHSAANYTSTFHFVLKYLLSLDLPSTTLWLYVIFATVVVTTWLKRSVHHLSSHAHTLEQTPARSEFAGSRCPSQSSSTFVSSFTP